LPAQDHLELWEILHHRSDNRCGICHKYDSILSSEIGFLTLSSVG